VFNGDPEMSDHIFELVLKEKPIKLKGGDGFIKNYVIREFDGLGRDKYQEEVQKKVFKEEDGKSLYSTTGLAAFLLSQTLFEVTDGGAGRRPIPLSDIQSFPPIVVDALGAEAKILCGLDRTGEETKNV
jgi:hypothetical protein